MFHEVTILRGAHKAGDGWSEGEMFYEVRSTDESAFGDHGAARTLEEAFEIFLTRKLADLERKLTEQREDLVRHQARNAALEERARVIAAEIEKLKPRPS